PWLSSILIALAISGFCRSSAASDAFLMPRPISGTFNQNWTIGRTYLPPAIRESSAKSPKTSSSPSRIKSGSRMSQSAAVTGRMVTTDAGARLRRHGLAEAGLRIDGRRRGSAGRSPAGRGATGRLGYGAPPSGLGGGRDEPAGRRPRDRDAGAGARSCLDPARAARLVAQAPGEGLGDTRGADLLERDACTSRGKRPVSGDRFLHGGSSRRADPEVGPQDGRLTRSPATA